MPEHGALRHTFEAVTNGKDPEMDRLKICIEVFEQMRDGAEQKRILSYLSDRFRPAVRNPTHDKQMP